jgi:hypothetical protein
MQTIDIQQIRSEVLAADDLPVFHDNETIAVMFGLSEAYNHAIKVLKDRQKRWPQSVWVLRFKALFGETKIAFLLIPLAQVPSTERTMPELTEINGLFHGMKFHSKSAFVVSIWEVSYDEADNRYVAVKQQYGRSFYNTNFVYETWRHVDADGFRADNICGSGIHYFANLWTALCFNSYRKKDDKNNIIVSERCNESWSAIANAEDTYLSCYQQSKRMSMIIYREERCRTRVAIKGHGCTAKECIRLFFILSIIRFGSIDAFKDANVTVHFENDGYTCFRL